MATVHRFSNTCLTFQLDGLKKKTIRRLHTIAIEHVSNYGLLYYVMLFPALTLKSRCLFGKPLGGSEFDNIETNTPHCKQSSHKTDEKHFTALPLVRTLK